MMTKQEAAVTVRSALIGHGVTWAQLAEAVGRPVVWSTAAPLGQHPMAAAEAEAAASATGLGQDVVKAPQFQPTRPRHAGRRGPH
jgi:cyanate lyase